MIAEELKELSSEFDTQWFTEAVKISADNNKRSLAYVRKILDRWKVDGFKSPLVTQAKHARSNGNGTHPNDNPLRVEIERRKKELAKHGNPG
jgi:DnaD/phage-associated family protein